MKSTGMERRAFLGAAGTLFAATLLPRQAEALEATEAVFASAFMDADRTFGVAVLDQDGRELARTQLPARGHDITVSPISSHAVAFARRPGTFALVFDRHTAKPIKLIQSSEDRHFFGHGAFSPDGRLLYVTENDFDNYRGVIGLYDVQGDYRKIGEFDAFGMDTHDLQLLEGGRYLAAANGGIKQHPSTGRAKLNLDHMEPSLVIIDASDGRMIEKHAMPDEIRQLSTRHMDIDANGRIWFGCQFEGPKNRYPQLLGSFRRGEDVAFAEIPENVLKGFDNYIGSVAVNRKTGLVAISSPEGGQWAAFSTVDGRISKVEAIGEVCGIAPRDDSFIRSTETGTFGSSKSDLAWDNHILCFERL